MIIGKLPLRLSAIARKVTEEVDRKISVDYFFSYLQWKSQ